MKSKKLLKIGETTVKAGESKNVYLKVSETATGQPVVIPVRVMRAEEPGPVGFVSAALHGDELNGVGVVRSLLLDESFVLQRGTLLLVPVINIFGFENHSRYLPDRRDLNRCFPGNLDGSLAGRLAKTVFDEIIKKSDFGIDIHTAATRRTNFPNVRADMTIDKVRELAEPFGCEFIINSKGPKGALRRESVRTGCPTIILEAGEPGKIEPSVLEIGLRGVKNVLIDKGMLLGDVVSPRYQVIINRTKWVRSDNGGLLQFHVAPGNLVEKDQPIATTTSLLGDAFEQIIAPISGFVVGLTTSPMVKPGEPVCHIGRPAGKFKEIRDTLELLSQTRSHTNVQKALATNVVVSEPELS